MTSEDLIRKCREKAMKEDVDRSNKAKALLSCCNNIFLDKSNPKIEAGSLWGIMAKLGKIIYHSRSLGRELREQLEALNHAFGEISEDNSSGIMQGLHSLVANVRQVSDELERVGSLDLYRKYRYGKKVLELQNRLRELRSQIPFEILGQVTRARDDIGMLQEDVHMMLNNVGGLQEQLRQGVGGLQNDMQWLQSEFAELQQQLSNDVSGLQEQLNDMATKLSNNADSNAFVLQQSGGIYISNGMQEDLGQLDFVVGLDEVLFDVKKLLCRNDCHVVGIVGMGGSGKSTLALALFNDSKLQGFFGKRIILITVSKSPNLMGILKTLWEKLMIGIPLPEFRTAEDIHKQLRKYLKDTQHGRILLILDDVWDISTVELLLFEVDGCKTVITTRDEKIIPKKNSVQRYNIPMLEMKDAGALFCFWAFGQKSVPAEAEADLVEQVVKECGGLPLALKVTGSCLRAEHYSTWKRAIHKLSRSEFINEHHKDRILGCMKASIDCLDDEVKDCFFDLGAFPKGQRFNVDAILDIWVYACGMDWDNAFATLLELSSRNLLDLTNESVNHITHYGCTGELYFSLHDVIRELIFDLSGTDGLLNSRRLFMAHKEDGIPRKWLQLEEQKSKAWFVSVHTGSMKESEWGEVVFPEAEVLALFFDAALYFLPKFLSSMPKLKVLLIYNYGLNYTQLSGTASIGIPPCLTCVRLEKLIIPTLPEQYKALETLKKVDLCLCQGLQNLPKLYFPGLIEVDISYCTDLEELPKELCSSTSLQRLSISNCQDIKSTPDCLDRLNSLKVLNLHSCLGLQSLPSSVSRLEQLEYLDISFCMSLKDLPRNIHQLRRLHVLNMSGCSRLNMLPELSKLERLKHVICGEDDALYWQRIKDSVMPNLIVEVHQNEESLDWLKD